MCSIDPKSALSNVNHVNGKKKIRKNLVTRISFYMCVGINHFIKLIFSILAAFLAILFEPRLNLISWRLIQMSLLTKTKLLSPD